MKLLRVIGITLVLFLVSCENVDKGDANSETYLFPVHQGEKWGYINQNGDLVIDYQFDEANPFSEGLACVGVGDWSNRKYGFINENGKTVIDFQFDEVRLGVFSEGLAGVYDGYDRKTRKFGYIDRSGKYVIEPIYDGGELFSEGLAPVWVKDRGNGYIDNKGNVVIVFQYDAAYPFSEGLAGVRVGDWKTGKYGFIDKTGQLIIDCQFDRIGYFSEGLAAVIKNGRVGFIDNKGRYVLDICDYNKYEDVIPTSALELRWNSAIGSYRGYWQFHNDIACIQEPHVNAVYSTEYVDKKGSVIVPRLPFGYFDGRNFSEGLAAVKKGTLSSEKYGYIDENDNIVIEFLFDDADDFHNGLACVVIGGKMAYIDKTGTVVWQEK